MFKNEILRLFKISIVRVSVGAHTPNPLLLEGTFGEPLGKAAVKVQAQPTKGRSPSYQGGI